MASVSIVDVSKTYGRVQAVQDLQLEIPDHELTCLLGPSGCGKTTTLRMIAGLEIPERGSIAIGGRDVTSLDPRHRDIAMVFQGYALYPHLRVVDNIAYPLKVRGVPGAERRRRAAEVAEHLAISNLLDRLPDQLSGGQKQKVALARAIIRQPQVYLFDEPLSALDAQYRATMRLEMKRIQKTLGTTTVMVTHDQLEAITMADHIAVLNHGVLQQFGPPEAVYHDPNNLFVASFVGEPRMNLIPCDYSEAGGSGVLVNSAFRLTLPVPLAQVPDPQVTLGIRPQHVRLHREARPGLLAGTVYVSEPEGTEALHEIAVGELKVTVKTDAEVRLEMDAPVWLEFPPERIYLFNTATGERIRSQR